MKKFTDMIQKCSECNSPEIKSKGMCKKCYHREYSKKRKYSKKHLDKFPNCLDCGLSFLEINMISKGLCGKCYRRRIKMSKKMNCSECGKEMMKGSVYGLCPDCKISTGTIKNSRPRKEIASNITKDLLGRIKLVLIRMKRDMKTDLDPFIIADLHVECYGHVVSFDCYNPDYQSLIMLKELKKIYDKYA